MLPESKDDGEQADYQMLKDLEDRNDALRCYKTKAEWEKLKKDRNEEWETECGTVSQGRSGRKRISTKTFGISCWRNRFAWHKSSIHPWWMHL